MRIKILGAKSFREHNWYDINIFWVKYLVSQVEIFSCFYLYFQFFCLILKSTPSFRIWNIHLVKLWLVINVWVSCLKFYLQSAKPPASQNYNWQNFIQHNGISIRQVDLIDDDRYSLQWKTWCSNKRTLKVFGNLEGWGFLSPFVTIPAVFMLHNISCEVIKDSLMWKV